MHTTKTCQYCDRVLSKDEVGLSLKLFDAESKRGKLTCLPCMAEILEVSEDDLRDKIKEFKAAGCTLFG